MAVYTNINRNNKPKKTNRNRNNNTQKLGVILLIVAAIGSIALFTNFLVFLRFFIMGCFGVFSYAIFSSLFIVSRNLIAGKQYKFNTKYTIYFLVALISFLSILQMAFLGSGTASNFGSYIADVYKLQTSVGGVTIALITYPMLKILNPIGAYIFYIITLTVASAFLIDSFSQNSVFKKPNRLGYVNYNQTKTAKKDSLNTPLFIKEKNKAGFITKLKNVFNKKQNQTTLSLNTAEVNNYKQNNNPSEMDYTFENQKQSRFTTSLNIENTQNLKSEQVNFNKRNFDAIFSNNQNDYTPKSLYGNENQSINKSYRKTSKMDDEIRKKNLEFLRSTIPTNKGKNDIISTSSNNPNEQFITQKMKERISQFKEEYGVSDIDAKFEEDLKAVSSATSSNAEDIIIKKPDEISTTKEKPKNNFEQLKLNEVKETKTVKPRYKKPSGYKRPPLSLLNTISTSLDDYEDEYVEKSKKLEKVLNDFRVPAKVIAVTRGPAVTRYELQMPPGVSVKKITQHAEDIAMTLASNGAVRIEAPIPGKNAVGVEVPNNKIATIALKDIIESKEFTKSRSNLTFALGKDIAGKPQICDLARMPHLLVAGATGSGKSVCLNSLIISLLYKSSPEDLRLILIDPKRVEFYVYNNLPHLMLPNVITDSDKALNALNWAIEEMERRFEVFQDTNVKNLAEYNMQPIVTKGDKPKLPTIVIIVDELADLMLTSKREVEDKIMRLAAKARAAGIHLVLATQRPSVDVITGTIKANLPSRIAFSVSSIADSKTILDGGGADKLLGKGDMLYAPIDYPEPRRIQGGFVSNDEVRNIVEYIKQNNASFFDDEVSTFINKQVGPSTVTTGAGVEIEIDDLLPQALKMVIENGQASTSMLQRKFSIGFSRAGRIMDQMEQLKYISPQNGSKARNVYITMERYKEIYGDE